MSKTVHIDRIVPLHRWQDNHLVVGAEVFLWEFMGSSDVMQFIVDTASARSFIVPGCQPHLEETVGKFDMSRGRVLNSQTMVGDLRYRTLNGFGLRFLSLNGTPFEIEPLNGELCFADQDGPLRKAIVPEEVEQSEVAIIPGENLPFNVLGRDVLNQATLIVPPQKGPAFLIFDFDFTKTLKKIYEVSEYLESRGRKPSASPEIIDCMSEDTATWNEAASTKRAGTNKD